MASFRIAVAATLSLLISAPVSAQSNAGGLASVAVSGMAAEEDIRAAVAVSIGYRFNPIVALTIEMTFVPSYTPDVPDFPTILGGPVLAAESGLSIFPVPRINIEAEGGRATFFTGNVRLTIPTPSTRFAPYLVGGGGVGNVTDEYRYTYGPYPLGFGLFAPVFTETIRRTTTDFAMTLGGGLGIRLSDRWSVDVDARYMGVAGERDINTGRYGAGITFRF